MATPLVSVGGILRPEDELPTNVETVEQLDRLPKECLSGKSDRPLRHVDLKGNASFYSLRPISYSVGLILIVELMERFAFYGVYYTQTLYLTGVYNKHWNPGFTSVDAATYVSISTAVAYTTPFIGAILSDTFLGDYKSILFGCIFLYLPGLALVAMTTVPGLLGDEFNTTALSVAVLFLWPMGTGLIKSVVNVFGARQFHPFLQSSLIESYYVNFYASINVGALLGILILPSIAQRHVTLAYTIPVVLLGSAVALFALWTPRYVIGQPSHSLFRRQKRNDNDTIPLSTMFQISLLIVPFCIAYSQMPTTFIVQGTVMNKAWGFIDPATINLIDTLSVLVFGYLTGTYLYPALQKRNIKIPTTHKFALGSFLGVLSILWALVVEAKIHAAYAADGSRICILWQAPSYVLIGAGEIFAVSAAYEVAFTASSPQTKSLASAINIFCVGGIPNALCIFLYQACQGWFRNSRGDTNIQHIADYTTAHVGHYFSVLVVILIIGVVLNVLPFIRDMVDATEKKAAEIVKTPLTPHLRPLQRQREGDGDVEEHTPLLGRKFGKEPVLIKMGSMREGPKIKAPAKIKARYLQKLYHQQPKSRDHHGFHS